MAFVKGIAILFSIYRTANAQCKWDSFYPGGSSTLDLSCAVGKELTTTDSEGHTYLFTICKNGESCSGQNVMVEQKNANGDCWTLGKWDSSIQPTYSLANGGMFTFEFANGDNDCGDPARTWVPTFRCDSSEFVIDQVTEISGTCRYEVEIHTKYACADNTECSGAPSNLEDALDGLSGGWIFIIIFV